MQIGKVIRRYRKDSGMTQEEMARRLGVTAPAVNKWENGNSMPDIMLLAPIARLLNITLDTLLSFREELTEEEINSIVHEADDRLRNESFEEAFLWVKKKAETYPNCAGLLLGLAVVCDAWRKIREIPEAGKYDAFVRECYVRALESGDEAVRNRAADALVEYYVHRGDYEKAEEYLGYFSVQNPDRKRKQAEIYSRTGRRTEAYRAYEELLFSGYQMVSMVFYNLYAMAMEDEDWEMARMLVEKQGKLADIFDMGKFREAAFRLEFVTARKDADAVIETMKEMLEGYGDLGGFAKSPLYGHMNFKEISGEFYANMKENLLKCFRDEETYGFLKEDGRWQELVSTSGRV